MAAMRPEPLNPLFADATVLAGIGPRVIKRLEKLLGFDGAARLVRVADLLWHLPTGLIDRRYQPKIAEIKGEGVATLKVTVGKHTPPPARANRRPYQVIAYDDTGEITLVFFHARADYLRGKLPEGQIRVISGRVDFFDGSPRMTHPDHMLNTHELNDMPLVEPVYPMTAGLAAKTLMKAITAALDRVAQLSEWQDQAWLARQGWPDFKQALDAAHHPQTPQELEPLGAARARLAYDELLANQLALGLMRAHLRRGAGRTIIGDGALKEKILAALPFALTAAQHSALEDIYGDMAGETRMLRLLQGDVGAGKTVIALLAMVQAAEAGLQSALMAPTELLSRQHLASLTPLAAAAGLRTALLTGREKGAVRTRLQKELEAGDIDILIGTHALFQDGVAFKDLGLAVIDEQHRFGVHQRLALQAKGVAGKGANNVDMLVMTATPIPRTLTLTHYGDMDVSRLNEKPAGRQPIDTRTVPAGRIDEVIAGLQRALKTGARAYWICPLVEATEEIDAVAAEERFKALEQIFPGRVGLVHGRLKGPDKDRVMHAFKEGEIDLLVATTVVEVGVDVPEATIMVVEHAERFGLAQLHQLRGRIGRGSEKSACILLYKPPLGDTAKARLKTLREVDDGFVIAEEDLRLRGAGEVLGVRQSGLPGYRLAQAEFHAHLLTAAHDDARLILAKDPLLTSKRGNALKTLLYLFERDEAVRLIGAG